MLDDTQGLDCESHGSIHCIFTISAIGYDKKIKAY